MFKRNLLLYILLLTGLILLAGNDRARTRKAAFLSHTLYYPFSSSLQTIRSIRESRVQNRQLHERNANLMLRVIDLENRIETMTGMNISFLSPDRPFVVADVIGFAGSFDQRHLIINRGLRDGLKVNDPVMNNRGAVGKIVSVGPDHASVLPLMHPAFRLGVTDSATGVQGVLESDAVNLYMTMMPHDAVVAIGDTVITSNLSTIFPRGVPVGRIGKLERHPLSSGMQAVVMPFAEQNAVEQVIVLLGAGQMEEPGQTEY